MVILILLYPVLVSVRFLTFQPRKAAARAQTHTRDLPDRLKDRQMDRWMARTDSKDNL
jgi:hypothetical protein